LLFAADEGSDLDVFEGGMGGVQDGVENAPASGFVSVVVGFG
jgi:hypothetical protein